MTTRHLMAAPPLTAPEDATHLPPLLVTVPEAARVMGVSETTAKTLVMTGEWPSCKIGRSRRVVYRGLVQWIESRQA